MVQPQVVPSFIWLSMMDARRFNGFVKGELKIKLLKDIKDLYIFNESDLHSAAYFYIRKWFEQREHDSAYVRCEPRLNKKKPDIVVFEKKKPSYVLELAMSTKHHPMRTNKDKVTKDLKKLRQYVKRISSIRYAFLVHVHDDESLPTVPDHKLRRHDYPDISIVDLNIRKDSETKRKRRWYEEWRQDFDSLETAHRSY